MFKIKIKIHKMLIGIGCSIGISAVANAELSPGGLFIEPALIYEMGNTAVNYPAPFTNSSGTTNGFGLGARLGAHLLETVFLGLDFRYSMPQFQDSTSNYNAHATSTNWGPVLGLQMPIVGMRVWASSIMGGELNPEKSGSFDVKFQEATGYRVGAGFHLSSLSLNLEYQALRYGKTNLEQIGPFIAGTTLSNVSLEDNAWRASMSFPIEF